jgi:hypothetical protein
MGLRIKNARLGREAGARKSGMIPLGERRMLDTSMTEQETVIYIPGDTVGVAVKYPPGHVPPPLFTEELLEWIEAREREEEELRVTINPLRLIPARQDWTGGSYQVLTPRGPLTAEMQANYAAYSLIRQAGYAGYSPTRQTRLALGACERSSVRLSPKLLEHGLSRLNQVRPQAGYSVHITASGSWEVWRWGDGSLRRVTTAPVVR